MKSTLPRECKLESTSVEHPPECPVISVVIANYNYANYLEQSVRSVLNQSFPNLECIIVDDCSTDDSRAVAEKLASEDLRVRCIYNTANKGEAGCRNVGINAARGAYVASLDADDWWEPTKLEYQIQALEAVSGVISFTGFITHRGNKTEVCGPDTNWLTSIENSLPFSNQLAHSTVVISTFALKQVGGYESTLPYAVDWDLWLRIQHYFGSNVFVYVDRPLANYRLHVGNMSNSFSRVNRGEWRVTLRAILRGGWGLRHPVFSCKMIVDQFGRQRYRCDQSGLRVMSALSALGCAIFSPLTPWRWKFALKKLLHLVISSRRSGEQ